MGMNEIKPGRLIELNELASYYANEYCPAPQVVNPVLIAEGLGISYSAGDYGGYFDGLLEYRNGRFHVFLHLNNEEHLYSPRVRFSFAHELGHYIIDSHRRALKEPGMSPHGSQGIFASDIGSEREADYFAACLLMPESRIKKDIFMRKFVFALVDEISRKYQVSVTAALLRFIALGNHPLMVVCSQKNRLKWRRFSEDFPFKRLNLGANNELPECTAAAEFFADGTKYKNVQEVFAEDWFVLCRSSDQRRPLNEYCVYYEVLNQVVSVIWEK
jgi:hypothetical protein